MQNNAVVLFHRVMRPGVLITHFRYKFVYEHLKLPKEDANTIGDFVYSTHLIIL